MTISFYFDVSERVEVKRKLCKLLNRLRIRFRPTLTMCSYQGKISGPLLDRIDMQIHVGALSHEELLEQSASESSMQVAQRVKDAAARQQARQGKQNNLLTSTEIDQHCKPDTEGEQMLRTAMTRLNWSARAYHRVLKLARTIADLDDAARVHKQHVAEAVQYRRALREQ